MTPRSRRPPAVSVRIYRVLLWAYPASFRRQYADEMADVFRDMAEAAVERRGTAGLIALWLRTVPDLIFTVVAQQLAETERRVAMWQAFWGRAHVSAALTAALILAALATPADPASMLIAAVPMFGIYLAALVSKGLGPRGRSLAVSLSILHALAWIRLLAVPAPLVNGVVGAEAVRSVTRVVSPPVVVLAVLPLLATLTTGVILGIVVWMSRGQKKTARSGPNEDAETLA